MTAQAATSVQSFVSPTTIDEAVAIRGELGGGAMFLAGGTDLGVMLRRRRLEPAQLIDLSRVAELRRLERSGDEIVIGGAVTHRTIESSPLFDGPLRALREACATVGSVQTRTVGTLGGNLCNASPAADTAPVLLAMGASVDLAGPSGRRAVSLAEFFTAYRTTALESGELLASIRVPVPGGPSGSAFLKLGRRRAMEISIACVAVRVDLAGASVAGAGVGLGSVAPVPVRSPAAEAALAGAEPGLETWIAAGAAAGSDIDPIDDVRASGAYRAAMVPVLVARAAATAAARAGGAA